MKVGAYGLEVAGRTRARDAGDGGGGGVEYVVKEALDGESSRGRLLQRYAIANEKRAGSREYAHGYKFGFRRRRRHRDDVKAQLREMRAG